MSEMHTYMNVPGLPTDFGSQIFEQRIMELQKEGEHSVKASQCMSKKKKDKKKIPQSSFFLWKFLPFTALQPEKL